MRRVRFLNCEFDPLTVTQTIDAVFALIEEGRRGWLSTVNVAVLMMMRADAQLQEFVDRAALVVADGQPLVWCSPWFGKALPERVTGVDLVDCICAEAARRKRRVYLLGASGEVVARTAGRLRECWPGLEIEYSDGYFTDRDAPARADLVRSCNADILFVAMGVPRQEKFIREQWNRLGVRLAIGVGGSFDVISGLRPRAPHWMQKIGMEWLFRLILEPRRLLKRYLVTNIQFIALVFLLLIRRGFGRS